MSQFIKTPVKGMCDFLPSDMRLREYVLNMIKSSYAQYGFMQIETPAMEHIENLTSKQGGDNEKLIFKVLKRGRDLQNVIEKGDGEYADNGLRYDLTVPLARYYSNNKEKLPTPFKSLQIGNVWRADNPQKGRFRQFTQCDIDIIGDESNLAEIELIAATSNMLSDIFKEINISEFTIRVNDRAILAAVAQQAGFSADDIASVMISLDKYDKIGLAGIKEELLQNGYAEEIVDKYLAMYENTSDVTCGDFCKEVSEEFLDKKVVTGIEEIMACVTQMVSAGVKIVFDPTLVRGMGYYTGTIFEIGMDGYNFSIAGGGRYDKMIGKFSGQDAAACGFSIGFERIITILKDKLEKQIGVNEENVVYLIHKDVSVERKMETFKNAQEQRAQGKTVVVQQMKKNVKAQVERLEAEGFTQFIKVFND